MLASLRTRSAAIVALIGSNVGADEILLAVALSLIAAGFWQAWRPGAFLVPGFVLLYIALPSRASFIARAPESEKDRRRKVA